MSIRFAAALLLAGLLLGGCSGTSSDGIGPTNPQSGNGDPASPPGVGAFRASFVPLSGVLPFPTDLYFNGSTDGSLNIPSTPFFSPAVLAALNALDGFSTNAPATARFSAPIDPATISPATVIMLEVDVSNTTKATVGFRRALAYGTDYTARVATTVDSGGSTLEILPLRPLTPSTGGTNIGYLIILTNGLQDVDGNAATPDTNYLAIKNAQPTCAAITNASLNGICLLTGAHLAIAGAIGVPSANIVLTFSFSTQATADTMGIAGQLAQPTPIGVVATGLDISALSPALPPIADIYVGTLEIPYYHDPAAPLTSSWQGAPFTAVPGAATTTHLTRFNPVPVKQADLDIPLFVTVPNAGSGQAKPVAGWPVVIFQHGLRGNRAQSAAVAAAYAGQGFVVAAIDIPLHGITDVANPLYQGPAERTFNLDLVDNTTGAAGADGVIDPSGSYIINLTSLLTSRDNLRQAAVDIVQLATSLPSLDLDGDTIADIDDTRIHYSGLSLGGIVGTVANAQPIATLSAYLSVPGGGVANLLRESAALSPTINAGLAAAGLTQGTTLYEQFFRDAQAVVDAGDPINYMVAAVARRPVLLTQVVNDTVVPNSATQRLINNEATWVKASAAGPTPVAAGTGTWVHFTSGSHGSLLDPTASLAVTTEMQTHAASLAASGGAAFVIANPGILEP